MRQLLNLVHSQKLTLELEIPTMEIPLGCRCIEIQSIEVFNTQPRESQHAESFVKKIPVMLVGAGCGAWPPPVTLGWSFESFQGVFQVASQREAEIRAKLWSPKHRLRARCAGLEWSHLPQRYGHRCRLASPTFYIQVHDQTSTQRWTTLFPRLSQHWETFIQTFMKISVWAMPAPSVKPLPSAIVASELCPKFIIDVWAYYAGPSHSHNPYEIMSRAILQHPLNMLKLAVSRFVTLIWNFFSTFTLGIKLATVPLLRAGMSSMRTSTSTSPNWSACCLVQRSYV